MNTVIDSAIENSNISDPWLTADQMLRAASGKKLIYWGCFEWYEKTVKRFQLPTEFLVDQSKNQQGTKAHHGYDVHDPSTLKDLKEKDKYFVIITNTAFYEVIDQMKLYGFVAGTHFCVTPLLQNMKCIDDITHHEERVLFSSSDLIKDHDEEGGGLYYYETHTGHLEKKLSAVLRGFTEFNGGYLAVGAESGIEVLDSDFNRRDVIPLPEQSYPHGIALDSKRGLIYIILARHDRIGVYDQKTLKEVGSIKLSDKYERSGTYHHHMNDFCLHGDSLYISMFSISGNVHLHQFDGGIVEYDLEKDTVIGPVVTGLWQPHSVKMLNGNLAYLDSMRGNLHLESHKIESHFNGYIRGLDFNGKYYFIGQSIHRYFDRMKGTSNNISVDSGVFMFDANTKACRLMSMPKIRDINTLSIYRGKSE